MPPFAQQSSSSHELLGWLLAQSAALIVALLWNLSMHRERATWIRERKELSNLLIQTTEQHWRDRWKERDASALQLDSALRNALSAFTELVTKRRG